MYHQKHIYFKQNAPGLLKFAGTSLEDLILQYILKFPHSYNQYDNGKFVLCTRKSYFLTINTV